MPAVSQAQQEFFGAEYARAKKGESTKTHMSIEKLREFAATKRKGLPKRVLRKSSRRK